MAEVERKYALRRTIWREVKGDVRGPWNISQPPMARRKAGWSLEVIELAPASALLAAEGERDEALRKVGVMGPELEAEFRLRAYAEREQETAEKHLVEVQEKRDDWKQRAEEYAHELGEIEAHPEQLAEVRGELERIAEEHEATVEVVPAELEKALREIASYNPDELREWDEENAADMVDIARSAFRAQPQSEGTK